MSVSFPPTTASRRGSIRLALALCAGAAALAGGCYETVTVKSGLGSAAYQTNQPAMPPFSKVTGASGIGSSTYDIEQSDLDEAPKRKRRAGHPR